MSESTIIIIVIAAVALLIVLSYVKTSPNQALVISDDGEDSMMSMFMAPAARKLPASAAMCLL